MKYKLIICLAFVFGFNLLIAQKTDKQYGFHTFLGVDVDNNSIKTDGLFVNGVYKGYGAEAAGLQRGDVLEAINSTKVYNFDELVKTLDKYKPGDKVEVSFLRNNSLQRITATVSDYPEFLKYNSMRWLTEMGNGAEVQRAKLGIEVDPDWEKYAVVVTDFSDNSAAENAGLEKGDIILKMDNYEFATIEELKYYLSKYQPGDKVNLSIDRRGEKRSIEVTLGKEVIHLEKKNKDKEKS
jgi:S1-C subfamily serine protease